MIVFVAFVLTVFSYLVFSEAMGRPRVIKHFLKSRAEIVKEVVKSSMRTLTSRHKEIAEGNPTCPSSLSSSVRPLREKLDAVKEKMANNTNMLEEMVAELPDGKLSSLKSLLQEHKKRKTRPSEDKLYEVVQLISEDFENLEKWEEHIQSLKYEVIECFFKVVLTQNNNEDAVPNYDLDKFDTMVQDTINYRRGLCRGSQRDVPMDNEEQNNSCCLM